MVWGRAEQFRGAAQPASDLYGLGGTLLYLLSGACPSSPWLAASFGNLQLSFVWCKLGTVIKMEGVHIRVKSTVNRDNLYFCKARHKLLTIESLKSAFAMTLLGPAEHVNADGTCCHYTTKCGRTLPCDLESGRTFQSAREGLHHAQANRRAPSHRTACAWTSAAACRSVPMPACHAAFVINTPPVALLWLFTAGCAGA